MSIVLLSLVVVTGVFANFIAPHDPTDASVRGRLLPPFWGGPRTAEKQVVEVPQPGQLSSQVSLEKAREQDPNVSIGDTILMALSLIHISEPTRPY